MTYATQSKGERKIGVPTSVLLIVYYLAIRSSVNALLTPKSANLHTNGSREANKIFSGFMSLWYNDLLFANSPNAWIHY